MSPVKRWRALLDDAFPDPAGEAAARPAPPLLFLGGALLVVLLFGLPLFHHLGGFDLDNDEAIYSHAALSIVQHGAWASPWSSPGSSPFLEKPPLQLWLVALGMLAGLPQDELGLRCASATLATLALLYLYALGWRAGRLIGGFAAAAVLFLFEPLLFDHGLRSNTMDAALLFAYCGGAWHLVAWMGSAAGDRARPPAPPGRHPLLHLRLPGEIRGRAVPAAGRRPRPPAAARRATAPAARVAAPGRGRRSFPGCSPRRGSSTSTSSTARFSGGSFSASMWSSGSPTTSIPGISIPSPYYFKTIWSGLRSAGTAAWVLLGLAAWAIATIRRPSFFGVFVLSWASCAASPDLVRHLEARALRLPFPAAARHRRRLFPGPRRRPLARSLRAPGAPR